MNILEARRRTLGKGVYKKTVEGNPAIAQGSLARRYPGITMQGWTEQDSTTGAQLFNSDSVVDGIISSGTVVENNNFVTSDFIPVTSGNVYSRSGTGAPGNFFYDKDKVFLQNVSGTVSIKTPDNAAYVRFCIEKDAYDVNKVMFNEGTTALPYEPYTGNQPSPSPEYPQEIVSAGKYDEGTGKWEYEITIANEQTDPDKNQTVTLTSDRPLTKWDKLEKRKGQWGWAYKSGTMTLDGTQFLGIYMNGFYFLKSDNWNIEAKDAYSDKLINKNRKNIRGIPHFSESLGNKYYCYVLSVSEIYGSTTGEIKQNLSQNPITFYYETAEETFVPLSESEQEAMNALHTFRPTTVLSNDCECEMTLTYKTKKSLEVTD